jgi:hypothetical protein
VKLDGVGLAKVLIGVILSGLEHLHVALSISYESMTLLIKPDELAAEIVQSSQSGIVHQPSPGHKLRPQCID